MGDRIAERNGDSAYASTPRQDGARQAPLGPHREDRVDRAAGRAFTKDALTIARTLASPRVSPKGITSGLRMLMFFINRDKLCPAAMAEAAAMVAREHRER